MPPKAKTESTELQVFNLDNLNPALLPELATFKEIQLKVVAENPFVEIVDTASRELAKKYRTARKTARTDLEKQDKLISSKFNDAKTKAKGYIAELIDMTYPGELKQQNEINRDEAELEAKRQEKARIEQERVDNINKEINDYVASWKTAFNLMNFDSIEKVSADFLESYTTYDTAILEEFDALFPTKVEELTKYLSEKTNSLTEAENARLEKLRIEEEAKLLAQQKAEFEAKQKLADEAEAKAKKEREDFEREKAEFEENKRLEAEKLKAVPEVLEAVIIPETIQPEKVEAVEILATELPTVNVCKCEEEVIPDKTTWESIENEFKSAGEKSYSKWLKDNYNPPTKKQ